MDEHEHDLFRKQITDFGNYLKNDWKKWTVMQIKQAMLEGKYSLFLYNMQQNDWKKVKTVLNFWKKNLIAHEDMKYYDKTNNVLVTNKHHRKFIDFLTDIGVGWRCVASQKYETFSIEYNQIHALIKY